MSVNLTSTPLLINSSTSGKLNISKFGVILSNFCFTESVFTLLLDSIAESLGAVPPSSCVPSTIIVGVLVNPLPGSVTTIDLICPLPINALAFAPDPPPPVIVINGVCLNPLPPSSILISPSSKPKLSIQCFAGYSVTSKFIPVNTPSSILTCGLSISPRCGS